MADARVRAGVLRRVRRRADDHPGHAGPARLSAILQHRAGTARQIYIGGSDGILRHDGGRWTWLPSPKRGPVRAIHVDASGQVWFGGRDSFGYLKKLPTGEQQYVDLAPQFAKDLHGQAFSDVWNIAEFKGTIWFRALRGVFAVDASGKRLGYWHRAER